MASLVQIGAILVSGALLLLVIDLVRRRKLTEEYSIIWILCAAALLVLSLWRDILHVTARWLGVYYPPAVLLLVLIFFVFVASLYLLGRHLGPAAADRESRRGDGAAGSAAAGGGGAAKGRSLKRIPAGDASVVLLASFDSAKLKSC